MTGLLCGAYTNPYDGLRHPCHALTPVTFLAWFFMIDGFLSDPRLPPLHRRDNPPAGRARMQARVFGGVVAFLSFGSVMMATRP